MVRDSSLISWDLSQIKGLKFCVVTIFNILKKINSSDHNYGTHKKKFKSMALRLFANISRSMMDQRLKFKLVAVFDLLKLINGSDCQVLSYKKKKKIWKTVIHPSLPNMLEGNIPCPYTYLTSLVETVLTGHFNIFSLLFAFSAWVSFLRQCHCLPFPARGFP